MTINSFDYCFVFFIFNDNNKIMRNLTLYYIAILFPFAIVLWFGFNAPPYFVPLLFAYILYRGFIDSKRLMEKGLIEKNEWWKGFNPYYTLKYFKQLYFQL